MRIHYLQHVLYEGIGFIETWADQYQHELTYTKFFNEETLPIPEDVDMLVIMGGPMSVEDEQAYPLLKKEKQFIEEYIVKEKKVIGICLGAQLIAAVLGCKTITMANSEIDWFPVDWQPMASWLNFLPARQIVLHWHSDTFEIPNRPRILLRMIAARIRPFLSISKF